MQEDENPLSFPKRADLARTQQYEHFDNLYKGEHFKAFSIKAPEGFDARYAKLRYIVANFAGLMSRVMADSLFGEKIVIDVEDKKLQKWVDAFRDENTLDAQLYESELINSRRGDAIFKLRVAPRENIVGAKSTVIVEEVPASIYFPQLDIAANRYKPKEDVLAWTFKKAGTTYLHKEIHRPGYIFTEIYRYDPNAQKIIAQLPAEEFGFMPQQATNVPRSLIFHIPNVRDGSGFWGTSDYEDLETLFFALNNRITKVDNILDKHSDPILAVPEGVIDENGQINRAALSMFEVANDSTGFNKPEYIVWNANLDAAMKEIDKLVDFLFMFSEIAPATMGMDKGGQVESGRALKFKLLRTLAKRNRKKIYFDSMLKYMIETAMMLSKAWNIEIGGVKVGTPEVPTIDWGDGIINDETEATENSVKRIDSGTISRADAIARLDNISPDDAKTKVTEIDEEGKINLPPALNVPSGPNANVPTAPNTGG